MRFYYPIIELGMKFVKPLRYDESMWIYTRISEAKRVRVMFDYIITHGDTGEIVCNGFTRHCALNRAGSPVAVDSNMVSLWKTFSK